MANSDKDIKITPNTGESAKPKIEVVGADNATKTLTVNDDGSITFDAALTVSDLTVSGTTTTLNTATMTVEDKNIVLGSGNSTSEVVDATGITLEGGSGSDITFQYNATNSRMELKHGSSFEPIKTGNIKIPDNGEITVDGSGYLQIGNTNSGTLRLHGDTGNSIIEGHVNHLVLQTLRDADDIRFRVNAGGTEDATVAEAMIIEGDTGHVGIATTNPVRPLHVVGDAYVQSGDILLSRGNFYLQDASDATKRGSFSSAGVWAWENVNVGIGTTTPSTALDVSGTVTVGNAALESNQFRINNTGGYAQIELGGSSGAFIDMKNPFSDDFDARLITDGNGLDLIMSGAGRDIRLMTNGTERFKVEDTVVTSSVGVSVTGDLNVGSGDFFVDDSAGRVGIGNTSPDTPLHIKSTTTSLDNLLLLENNGGSGTPGVGIKMFSNVGTQNYLEILHDAFGATNFKTVNGSDTYNKQVHLQSDGDVSFEAGNVAIGHASPTMALDVKGDVFIGNSDETTTLSGSGDLTIQGDTALATFKADNGSSGDQIAGIRVFADSFRSAGMMVGDYNNANGAMTEDWLFGRQYASTNKAGIFAAPENGGDEYITVNSDSQKAVKIAGDNDDIDFIIHGSSGEYLRAVASTGKVGIGTASPDELLEIMNGSLKITREETDDPAGSGVTEDTVLLDITGGLRWTFSKSFDDPNPVPIGTTTDNDIRIMRYNQTHAQFYWNRTYLAKDVGIGETDPDARLHVKTTGNGDSVIIESTDVPSQNNDMAPNLVLLRSGVPDATTNTDAGKIQFKALDSDGGTVRTLAHIQSEFNTATGGNGSARLRFNVSSSGGSGHNDYEYMRFDGGIRDIIINENGVDIDFRIEGDSDTSLFFTDASTDRIGIGTNSPDTKLHVSSGTVLLGSVFDKPTNSTFDAADAQLILGGAFNAEFNAGTDKAHLLISSHDNDDGTALYPIFVQDENVGNNSDALSGADFFIKNRQVSNGDSTAYFGGKVGIGNISPATKLDVNGSITVADDIIHSGDTNTKIAFGTDTQSFQTGGTARFNISNTGLQIGTGSRVTTILDQDNMASNSSTALATQQSIKAYVDSQSGGGGGGGASAINDLSDALTASTGNLGLGSTALDSIASGGNYNTAVGVNAGTAITTADNNTAVGYEALSSLQTSNNNVAIGYHAGRDYTNQHSVFIGSIAGRGATNGNYNTAIGSNSMYNLAGGYENTALGYQAGFNLTGTNARWNTVLGKGAGNDITGAQANVVVGRHAADGLQTGQLNVILGTSANGDSSNGGTVSDTVAIGYQSGYYMTGDDNTLVGHRSGFGVSGASGTANVSIGQNAGDSISSGSDNTSVGALAGSAISSGSTNICIGHDAGDNITTGSGNVVIGGSDIGDGTENDQLKISSGDGDVTWITGSPEGKITILPDAKIFKPVVFMDSGNVNVTTSETTIPFDTEVLDPSSNAFLVTELGGDGKIRLVAGGYYQISYSIPINDDGTSGADRTRVFVDMQTSSSSAFSSSTTVAQSRAQVYTRESSGGSGLSTTFIYQHTANDYIRLRIDAELSTNISTETNQSQISIKYLGA